MSGRFYRLKFLKHCFFARNTKGYGVHSPFLFDFTQTVIRERQPFYCFSRIERVRKKLWQDHRIVSVENPAKGRTENKKVCDIAKNEALPLLHARLLFRTASFLKAKQILEFGTSLGTTTCYLAAVASDAQCITAEPNKALLAIAQENFRTLGLENIRTVEDNIVAALPLILSQATQPDMVLLNMPQRPDEIMECFEQCAQKKHNETVFVVVGIHRSGAMQNVWQRMKNHPDTTATIDLFETGFVFFNKYLAKKNYKMRL